MPSFYQRPNSSCIKFFGLLSHPQQDFVLNVVIISSSSSYGNRLGISLGCKHLADDDAVQHEVLLGMRQQLKELYAAGIGGLIKR
ncbi:hypothetical protein AVEN_93079-1 [Araneus ventricosus]|uniref:Uncharacterized protein n=1 Tax=Araneus ventricosus TaxID=182803 RepID=A0A4Y2J3K9_ARAVE|nr:hypothetical protein AVEN_93079-1 [Araneus ventricosus]